MAETRDKLPLPKGLCTCCKVRKKMKGQGRVHCNWCWLERQPIETQVMAAQSRLEKFKVTERPLVARMPKDQWDPGSRWCAGCQSMVPIHYCGEGKSRCPGCEWKARRSAHVEREYDISEEEYWKLWNWQGGKCYMCGRASKTRALAVDHDHTSGRVRGLLCAHNEFGCNMAILGNVTGIEMARQIVKYLEKYPIDRMRDGEPPPMLTYKPRDLLEEPPY